MLTDLLEIASTSRAGCQSTECKKVAAKIPKGELRCGVFVTIKDNQTWRWKHWGCVTPVQIEHIKAKIEDNLDYLDGYDEIPEEAQERVGLAIEEGHVADSDWKGEPEMNRPGQRGYVSSATKKQRKQEQAEAKNDEPQNNGEKQEVTPAKTPTNKRKRRNDDDDDAAESSDEVMPTKKARGKKVKEEIVSKVKHETSDEPVKVPKSKSKSKAKVKTEDDDDLRVPISKGSGRKRKNVKDKPVEESRTPSAAHTKTNRGKSKSRAIKSEPQSDGEEEANDIAPVKDKKKSGTVKTGSPAESADEEEKAVKEQEARGTKKTKSKAVKVEQDHTPASSKKSSGSKQGRKGDKMKTTRATPDTSSSGRRRSQRGK